MVCSVEVDRPVCAGVYWLFVAHYLYNAGVIACCCYAANNISRRKLVEFQYYGCIQFKYKDLRKGMCGLRNRGIVRFSAETLATSHALHGPTQTLPDRAFP